jgi:hypothetical protein
MARKAYDTRVARKTRADQVKKVATVAEANAGHDKSVYRGREARLHSKHHTPFLQTFTEREIK